MQSTHTETDRHQVFWSGTGQRRKSDGLDTILAATTYYYYNLIYQPKEQPT